MYSGVKCAYWAVRLTGTGKECVGQFARPKAYKPAQHSLLFGGCITVFGLKCSQQPDRRNIVPRTVLPAGGKATGSVEAEVGLGDDQWGFCDGGGEGAVFAFKFTPEQVCSTTERGGREQAELIIEQGHERLRINAERRLRLGRGGVRGG